MGPPPSITMLRLRSGTGSELGVQFGTCTELKCLLGNGTIL